RQQANAEAIVEHLREHEAVRQVRYPGSHSEEEARIHASQARGNGAVLSFELEAGLDSVAFLRALRLPAYAVSLGGAETLICRPATMTHEAMTAQARPAAGISDGLLRLRVRIEDVADLLDDRGRARAAAGCARAAVRSAPGGARIHPELGTRRYAERGGPPAPRRARRGPPSPREESPGTPQRRLRPRPGRARRRGRQRPPPRTD